ARDSEKSNCNVSFRETSLSAIVNAVTEFKWRMSDEGCRQMNGDAAARMADDEVTPLTHGIRVNLKQFLHQLLQVLLVGFTIGMMRTVVPALADAEFGVPRNSFLLLSSFVVAFGFVKGALNFVAGRLSERIGRKKVLLLWWFGEETHPRLNPRTSEPSLQRGATRL
ncbi:MAG: MFS transporter, partial [Gemmatimonadaceae bacterium]|nr:MFS transporter [Gemmatimonadaceae bacterium]